LHQGALNDSDWSQRRLLKSGIGVLPPLFSTVTTGMPGNGVALAYANFGEDLGQRGLSV
jgi:hypothetical protein